MLSRTEWAKYYTVIGTKPTGARFNQTWMRTGSGNAAQMVTIAVNGGVNPNYASGKTRAINGAAKSKNDVRPCFYLDKTYFAENKIDVSSAGDEVKKFIRENYTREDMESIYDISEMVRLGYHYDGLLEVSDVTLTMGDDSITPVTVSYTWNSETTEYGSTYDWYVSADGTNNWTKVTTTTVKEYNIRAADGGKYLKCIVSPNDEDFNPSMPAESNVVGPLPNSRGPVTVQESIYEDQPHDTPEENVFSISGNDKKFIFLDTNGSGDSKFFVLADDQYGIYNWRKDYNADGSSVATAKYDPSNPDSIASQMNSEEFLAKLPVEVVSHIDAQHTWITEAGNKNSDIPGDYTVDCAISFLSYAEWQQYHSKIGYDNGMLYGWFLRTARGDIDGSPYAPMYVCTDNQAGEKMPHTRDVQCRQAIPLQCL